MTTDNDGSFELPIRLKAPTRPYTLEIGVAQSRGGDSADTLGALLDLPKLEPGQRRDLGAIPLALLPVLAHGTVLDDRGEPVTGARITLQVFRPDAGRAGGNRTNNNRVSNNRGRNGLPTGQGRSRNGLPTGRQGAWLDEDYQRTETDEAGRYRLRGLPRPARLRLRAGARGHVTATSAGLTVGEQVDFKLSRTGTLMVNGQLPGWVPRPPCA